VIKLLKKFDKYNRVVEPSWKIGDKV